MFIVYVAGDNQTQGDMRSRAQTLGLTVISTSVPPRYAPIIESIPCVVLEGGVPVREIFIAEPVTVDALVAIKGVLQSEEDQAEFSGGS
jgi:hypothetical protein